MAGFHQFFMISFMEFINIGPVYNRGWVGEARGGVSGGKSLNKEEKDTSSRIQSSYDVYLHSQRTNIPL